MGKATDIRVDSVSLYFLPVTTRVPLKFGKAKVTADSSATTCARVQMTVVDASGSKAEGWGEGVLGVAWSWPSDLSYIKRKKAMEHFCEMLVEGWASFDEAGHPMEVGDAFQKKALPDVLAKMNEQRGAEAEPMPWLSALICCSAFDIALHDAFANLVDKPVYETYGPDYMNKDLAYFLEPAADTQVSFEGKYPEDYLVFPRPDQLPVWHLVGGLDALNESELTGNEPDDGYPVTLTEWIRCDGLNCLKVKMRGNDADWDYARLLAVGNIAIEGGVDWLTCDFNCTVNDPEYVNVILDRLVVEHPRIYGMILYVEQPFPYDLEQNRIDVHSVSARKPLFMDESAHDWELVKLGRELGWTGVALKTCKTQTGALLSLCWAKAHGMTLMVQDLTNPMLAHIPHVLLAAHAGTIMGVESNGMQFWPDASLIEGAVHPGLYKRRDGVLDLSTIRGSGFGYRIAEIGRDLPAPVAESSSSDGK